MYLYSLSHPYFNFFFQFGQHVLKKTKKRSLLFQERRRSASPLSGPKEISPSAETNRIPRKLSEKEQSPLANFHNISVSPINAKNSGSPEYNKENCCQDMENISPNPDGSDPTTNTKHKPLVRRCSSPILGRNSVKSGPRSSSPLAEIDSNEVQQGKGTVEVKNAMCISDRQCKSAMEKKTASPLTERNQ